VSSREVARHLAATFEALLRLADALLPFGPGLPYVGPFWCGDFSFRRQSF
jgi:hypothetical protein